MKDRSNIDGTIKQILPFKPSTLETIDFAVFDWVQEQMDIFCNTNKGFKKVPCVWVAGERSWQVKNHKDLRDSDGALIFPIITVQRNKFTKNLGKKGTFYGNIPPVKDKKGGSITIARRVQQAKTANFTNANTYRKKAYTISARTEYQQQMNEIIQPFVVDTGGINSRLVVSRDKHQYEAFMEQDFSTENNITDLGNETRIYESTITLNVLGYLVGADKNQKQPNIVIRENAVEVRIPREQVVFEDSPEWRNGKYRS